MPRSKLMLPVTGFIRSAGLNLTALFSIVPLAGQMEKCAGENLAERVLAKLVFSRLANDPSLSSAPAAGGAPIDPLTHSH